MKNMIRTVLAVFAVGLFVWGAPGVALADHNNPNLAETGHPGYEPDYYAPMDTTQPGWIHSMQSGGYVGYPPDYSNVPNWIPKESAGAGVSAQPQTPQAQPVVPFAPYPGTEQGNG